MNTPFLNLPLLAAGQSQKHVTHNDALYEIDDIVHLAVEGAVLNTPPLNPTIGARYLIGANPTGSWQNKASGIAVWRDNSWIIHMPSAGWQAYVKTTGGLYIYDGAQWVGPSRWPFLGLNATADTTNRLTVSAPASLFTHEGAGHQIKLNKASVNDTASLLFQTGYSSRAEIGLNGSDTLSFKVSANGSVWAEALRISSSGSVSLPNSPNGIIGENLVINGNFVVNQRAFAGGTLALATYGYDRWRAAVAGTSLSLTNGMVTLAGGELAQTVEPQAFGFISFAGLTMTISLDNPSADMRVVLAGVTGTITAGSGRRAVSLAIPTGFTSAPGLALSRLTGSGVSFSRVKLEIGEVATAWISRPLSAEQMLAQRYFYRLTGPISLFLYAQGAANYFFNSVPLPVPMRTTPTVTRNLAASGNIFQNDLANATASALSAGSIRLSVRSNAAGECYANFDRVDCDAEL